MSASSMFVSHVYTAISDHIPFHQPKSTSLSILIRAGFHLCGVCHSMIPERPPSTSSEGELLYRYTIEPTSPERETMNEKQREKKKVKKG